MLRLGSVFRMTHFLTRILEQRDHKDLKEEFQLIARRSDSSRPPSVNIWITYLLPLRTL
jgi:hypothetical protein